MPKPARDTFTDVEIDRGIAFIQQLPKIERPKRASNSVAETVGKFRKHIRDAMRRGQSLEAIVDGLNAELNKSLRVSSVKSYLNRRPRTGANKAGS